MNNNNNNNNNKDDELKVLTFEILQQASPDNVQRLAQFCKLTYGFPIMDNPPISVLWNSLKTQKKNDDYFRRRRSISSNN
jgi:hypothetical protein